jgi:hypothetical protein
MKTTKMILLVLVFGNFLFGCHTKIPDPSIIKDQGGKSMIRTKELHVRFKTFFLSLQEAVKDGDKNQVADLCGYPLLVTRSLKQAAVKIPNKSELLKQYDEVFNDNVKDIIITQNINDIFERYTENGWGYGFWDGSIWAIRTKDSIEIKSIITYAKP